MLSEITGQYGKLETRDPQKHSSSKMKLELTNWPMVISVEIIILEILIMKRLLFKLETYMDHVLFFKKEYTFTKCAI